MSSENKSTIIVSTVKKEEVLALATLIREAFDADTALHTDAAKGGPPGYDNGQLLVKLLADMRLVCRVVYSEGQLVGFFCLKKQTQSMCELRLFCVATNHHNQGQGTKIWQEIEQGFPHQTWQVETPQYSLRNRYFYTEKCGFQEIGQKQYGSSTGIILGKEYEISNRAVV